MFPDRIRTTAGRHARRITRVALAALLAAGAPSNAFGAAEVMTSSALKAAFLYNFANFAVWPVDALAPRQRLSMCVVGDDAVADALEQTIKGRSVDHHELTVEVIAADGPIRSCHLLYVGGLDKNRRGQLLESLKDASIFTVSDGAQFAAMGGVAQLILENGRMRFGVNVDAAQRARLKISSKLLSLAQIIKDQPDVQP